MEHYEKKSSALLSQAVSRNEATENVLKTADPLNEKTLPLLAKNYIYLLCNVYS